MKAVCYIILMRNKVREPAINIAIIRIGQYAHTIIFKYVFELISAFINVFIYFFKYNQLAMAALT